MHVTTYISEQPDLAELARALQVRKILNRLADSEPLARLRAEHAFGVRCPGVCPAPRTAMETAR